MKPTHEIDSLIRSVNQTGVSVLREIHGLSAFNENMVFPYLFLTLCTKGSARARYDMQEITQSKNDLGIILPGHIMTPLECSDDYTYIWLAISEEMLNNLKMYIFSHDYEKFNYTPVCRLSDEQAEQLTAIVELLDIVSTINAQDLTHRKQLLLSQLSIGYDLLNYYRREMDKQWSESRYAALFNRFQSLVAVHYKESREVKFYADKLHLSAKHFTKVIRTVTGDISPSQWINEYVTTQAKQLIDTQPNLTFQQIAYNLGFRDPTLFHHYFKRVTGLTPQRYRQAAQKKDAV